MIVLSAVDTKFPNSVSFASSPSIAQDHPIVYVSVGNVPALCVVVPSSIPSISANNAVNVNPVFAVSLFFWNVYLIGLYPVIAPFSAFFYLK